MQISLFSSICLFYRQSTGVPELAMSKFTSVVPGQETETASRLKKINTTL